MSILLSILTVVAPALLNSVRQQID